MVERARNSRRAHVSAIVTELGELTLLPARGYEARYTPDRALVGFAFDGQVGRHAFASDRERPFRTRPNSVAYTPAGCDVFSSSAQGGEYLVLRLAADEAAAAVRQFNDRAGMRAVRAAEALRRLILQEAAAEPLEIDAQARAFVDAVIGAPTEEPREARWMTARRFERIQQVIEARLHAPLPVAELAEALQLSPGFLSRAFKAAIGVGPHEYVLNQRIARARRLLADSRLGAAEIAVACGFSSQAHLTTQMRRRLGVTPAAYRRALYEFPP
ncbi:MAG: AraC family transcriptional regulator [Neomegalonema sp.]|nr:AraC family transcriptional regulator [Neomegalonema sp.]